MQLNAFDTPSLRIALDIAKDKLLKTQRDFDTMRAKCNYLEEQILAKENYFSTRESSLRESNERELERGRLYFTLKILFSTFHCDFFFINVIEIHT